MDRIPKLRKGSRGRALVEYHRRRFYLGQFGTPEARPEYKEWVTRFIAGDFDGPRPQATRRAGRMAIAVLATRYLKFCEACCSPAEFCNVKESVRVVVERFGRFDAASFGAPELVDVQSDMIRKGWRHRGINQRFNRVRRWLRWAAATLPERGVTGTPTTSQSMAAKSICTRLMKARPIAVSTSCGRKSLSRRIRPSSTCWLVLPSGRCNTTDRRPTNFTGIFCPTLDARSREGCGLNAGAGVALLRTHPV